MYVTHPTETRSAPADRRPPAPVPMSDVRPRRVGAVASEPVLDESRDRIAPRDHDPRAGLDTSDDPTGAALAWPFVMLLGYVGLALAFVVAH
jgi:hypothetical protein